MEQIFLTGEGTTQKMPIYDVKYITYENISCQTDKENYGKKISSKIPANIA